MDETLRKISNIAKNLIKKYYIVIETSEYEILCTSIHAQWEGHRDPFVHKGGHKKRESGRWFIINEDYNQYIDFDISGEIEGKKVVGGIRINSLKRCSDGTIFNTCGEVFDLVKKFNIPSICNLKQSPKNTPQIYLRKRNNQLNSTLYQLPRFGDFGNKKLVGHGQLKFLFLNLMYASTLEWVPECTYSQYYILMIHLKMTGKLHELKKGVVTDLKINRYEKFFNIGKSKPYLADKKTPLRSQDVCELYGYFYSRINK